MLRLWHPGEDQRPSGIGELQPRWVDSLTAEQLQEEEKKNKTRLCYPDGYSARARAHYSNQL